MRFHRHFMVLLILLFASNFVEGQNLSNLQSKSFLVNVDTLVLDEFSIIPGSEIVEVKGENFIISQEDYELDYANGLLIWKAKPSSPEVEITYRQFPISFSKVWSNKNPGEVSEKDFVMNPFQYIPEKQQQSIFDFGGLEYNGSLSRGLSFGNSQDVILNSSFNLQLSGHISDEIEVVAAITDNNVPVQPEGNTQQLQEFDKVFIQVKKDEHKLTVGDYDLGVSKQHFMKFFRKSQGGSYSGKFKLPNEYGNLNSMASFAITKGKFSKNKLAAEEGNQGPYKLIGANGESFIIVLGGTERVFNDGKLMIRGSENDYVIDYNLGELTFTPNVLVTKDLRIVVEFEYSDKSYFRSLFHVSNEYEYKNLNLRLDFVSEQDSKNQPVQVDLESNQKALLETIGDSLQNAFMLGDILECSDLSAGGHP